MAQKHNFFNNSVASRTVVLVLVVTGAIMLTAGYFQTQHVRNIVALEMDRQANRSMIGAIKVIHNRLNSIETAVKTAAAFADKFAQDEQTADSLMKRLITSNNDISAVTLLYKENYFSNHGRYFAPTISKSQEGDKLISDEIGGPENDFCYLETDSNWVYTNKLDRGYWCLPYVDSMSTKRSMVTYSVPLHDKNNNIYAVLCADIDLQWVNNIVEEAKPFEYSHVIVMSRDSQYVCHPDKEWVLSRNVVEHARKQRDKNFLSLVDHMLRHERGNDTLEMMEKYDNDPTTNEDLNNFIVYYAPIENVIWSVCFLIPEDDILEGANRLRTSLMVFIVLLLVGISILIYLIIHKQLRPLEILSDDAKDIANGRFDTPLPEIKTNDEIRHLRDSFAEMQSSLRHYIEELKSTTAKKASMESELNIASGIQMSMLPKVFPPYPDRKELDIFGALTPAKGVGGDLYDFYIRDEKLFFCIGDVSGKGVPASLVMATTRTLFRTISNNESEPNVIMESINHTIADNNDTNMFVTLFVGVLDLKTGNLKYTNAGHDAPIIISDEGSKMLTVDANLPIGVITGFKYSLQQTSLHKKSTIFLYTDGLTEAENTEHELFGSERTDEVIHKIEKSYDPKLLIETMTDAVHQFVGKAEQSDDLTMLAITYTKDNS